MCIGPMCLVQMATLRATRWVARRMANGGSKRMSCASIAARMMEAATKCGCSGRMSNLGGKAWRPHLREFCSGQRPVIDLELFHASLSDENQVKNSTDPHARMRPIRDIRHFRGRTIQKDFRTTNSGKIFWVGNDRRSSLAGGLRPG